MQLKAASSGCNFCLVLSVVVVILSKNNFWMTMSYENLWAPSGHVVLGTIVIPKMFCAQLQACSLISLLSHFEQKQLLNGNVILQSLGNLWASCVVIYDCHTKMVFCYQNCSDLLWEKIVLVIEKNFWNSRLKAENLQNFWDH